MAEPRKMSRFSNLFRSRLLRAAYELGFFSSINDLCFQEEDDMEYGRNEQPTEWSGGPKNVAVEGKYHVCVIDVREGTTKTGGMYDKITVEVLAGTANSERGKRASVSLFRAEGYGDEQWTDGYKRWAWATGLLVPGARIDFTPSMLVGKTCVVNIVLDADKKYANIGNRGDDVWLETHPDVASVPKYAPTGSVQASQANVDDLF